MKVYLVTSLWVNEDETYNTADVFATREAALEFLNKSIERELQFWREDLNFNLPANAGKPWTKEDEDLLVSLYRSGTPKREICKTMQRTESGVAARLVHLGIIDNRDIFRDRK
jgi:hypothetical protein